MLPPNDTGTRSLDKRSRNCTKKGATAERTHKSNHLLAFQIHVKSSEKLLKGLAAARLLQTAAAQGLFYTTQRFIRSSALGRFCQKMSPLPYRNAVRRRVPRAPAAKEDAVTYTETYTPRERKPSPENASAPLRSPADTAKSTSCLL